MESMKQTNVHVVCGSVQREALHLDSFRDDAFDYLIVDEPHRASADTYQKVLSYFKPTFIFSLTATPERTDNNKMILDIFKKYCSQVEHLDHSKHRWTGGAPLVRPGHRAQDHLRQ